MTRRSPPCGLRPSPALRLIVGPRDLIVVAGLPGAGKTTLLGRLLIDGRARVLDSEQARDLVRRRIPGRLPYRWYRPLVHLLHRARVLVFAAFARTPLVVHDPATRVLVRVGLLALGLLTGRPCRLLWVQATPREALDGQRARGRRIRPAAFVQHVRRAPALHRRLCAGRRPRGWASALVLTRAQAAGGLTLVVRPPWS